MSSARKAPIMPDSSISMAAMKPRLRSRTKPVACGESKVTQHHQRGQQHQPQRNAVDAQVKTNAQRRNPGLVDLHLEAGLGGSKAASTNSDCREGDQRHAMPIAAAGCCSAARHQHRHDGADEGQRA